MTIVDLLRHYIVQTLTTLSIESSLEQIVLEHPKELSHGDYSTNIALILAKQQKINPKALAETIVAAMKTLPTAVAKVEVAGPGFINFFLTDSFFLNEIATILEQKDVYGKNNRHEGKKILVEHSSPNLFKPFHIGHVMNNTIGEAITRLAKFSGATVHCISYPSDVSLGIGKALWVLMADGGIEKLKGINSSVEELVYLGDCYIRGTKLYDEDPKIAEEMRAITNKIYNKDVASIEYQTYEDAKLKNLAGFKAITNRLGSNFQDTDFIFESEAGVVGKSIVEENVGTVFKQSEGAVIYEGEQDGLHTRVFINKDGNPTYEAKDIGLIDLKFTRYSPDLSIFITDHEQKEYFKVVGTAASKINTEWKERVAKTLHRTHGRMSFKGQKMSSRLGGVPLAQKLVDEIFQEVVEKATDLNSETEWTTINAIAIAALKFSILRVMAGKNMNFDPETSLSFEGDSGPYLQYVVVRAQSLLQKAKEQGYTPQAMVGVTIGSLERQLQRFPEVVDLAVSLWEPHHIAIYLLELAQAFNSWYATTKIIDAQNSRIAADLALVQATLQVVTNGLQVLGIQVPKRM